MDRRSGITPRDLERMVLDETTKPMALPLSLLEEITNGFSDDQEIGSGGFAVVYKGELDNTTVAVKRLSIPHKYEKEFNREVECLMMVKHKNIVRFLGYCADTQGSVEKYKGKFVMADVQKTLLCFEYLYRGSLHKYITDSSHGLKWKDRYQIITEICEGLHYLHQKNIAHLDLKPANILLDDNLVAKIADFGLARCFDEMQSRVISKIDGTYGYLAPECLNHSEVACRDLYRLDIYSLGVVIMEILTGKKEVYVVDNVVESWSNMVDQSERDEQLEQVQVCAEIGIQCTNSNLMKRPDMKRIINWLDGIETMDEYINTGLVTSQHAENAPNEQHQGMPSSLGETSSNENATTVTVERTNPCNNIWENTSNLDKLNETMHSLNPDIKRCFEFCSIFPRGSKLRSDDLVRMWIAHGFVKTSCATQDMEEIARWYIQDLVSISFLEAIETSSDTDCFRVHGALHDILDKVDAKCFRIENARTNRGRIHQLMFGNVWKGDVPPETQHLLIQHYDGKLITKTIIGLEYLRTLIVYIVGKDTPIEEKVIESICRRLPKLRVLAFAFSQEHDPIKQPMEFSFLESVGQLEYLRYLAFRANWDCKITLPSTINKLYHIQLLDFGKGDILEFTFSELVNLRHIFCRTHVKFPFIGRLSSLQKLPHFMVRTKQGYELKQLSDLNKLQGKLWISGLENVKSKGQALQANLAAKQITKLTLDWDGGNNTSCSSEVEADVLEGLCPPVGLKILELSAFVGCRYPDWMLGKQRCGPKYLQELHLWRCCQPGPASELAKAFPHLRVLKLQYCSWENLPGNMDHLTALEVLVINLCENIRSLPLLPHSLEVFRLIRCNDEFMKSCQTVGHANWQKIEHIPRKVFGDPACKS